jgi:catechol 2,3-dioxygenase-like lactoylglutathione lyase family enzyme
MASTRTRAHDRLGEPVRPGLSDPQNCHRVAVAVEDLDAATATWQRIFGLGLMIDLVTDTVDNSRMGILWAGNMPLLGLASTDPEGTVGRYLRRNGPSVQSLAWEIEDMWRTDHRLRANGIAVTGVHIEGRHFFMHPRNTFGLLLEFTDDILPHDPRQGDTAPKTTKPIIAIDGIARVTAAVTELDPVVEQFRVIFGVEPTFPVAEASGDKVADFLIGDLTTRLVQPGEGSPFATSVQSGMGRLHSVALKVSDFASIDADVAKAGLRVTAREADAVWIDPADMHGIRFELVA